MIDNGNTQYDSPPFFIIKTYLMSFSQIRIKSKLRQLGCNRIFGYP